MLSAAPTYKRTLTVRAAKISKVIDHRVGHIVVDIGTGSKTVKLISDNVMSLNALGDAINNGLVTAGSYLVESDETKTIEIISSADLRDRYSMVIARELLHANWDAVRYLAGPL